ncbi:MAG: hypothetical protein JNK82_42365, partial [Myxococcaceae bacterium]|nr:hypothetical protein [Myxococcaceae bacterium]
AKAKLAELGIDLNAKGTQVPCAKSCDLGHGAQLVFENATKKTTSEDEMEGTLKGTIRVFLKTSKEKTKLLEQSVKLTFTRIMGGDANAVLRPVERSPKGDAVIIRASVDARSGRGGTATIHPIGYLGWNGENWVIGGVPKLYIPGPTPE